MELIFDPKHWLFEKLFSLKGHVRGPLFSTQRELADWIVQASDYYKKPESIRTILSQSLKPVFDGGKALPPKMELTIFELVQQKLENESDFREFKEKFENIFKLDKPNFADLAIDDLIETVKSFQEWTETATDHFIFTSNPAELFWKENAQAQDLVNKLIYGLSEKKHKYHFYLPDITIAAKFWRALRDYLKEVIKWDDETIHKRITEYESKGKLNVKVVPGRDFLFHMAYFEIRNKFEEPEQSELFLIEFQHNNRISIMKHTEERKQMWYNKKVVPIFLSEKEPSSSKVRTASFKTSMTMASC